VKAVSAGSAEAQLNFNKKLESNKEEIPPTLIITNQKMITVQANDLDRIFEAEKIFGKSFKNSEDKIVYTRYVGEQHVKEDCYGHIPCAKDWIDSFIKNERPVWMRRTQELNIED
jgi:hypothetical protein